MTAWGAGTITVIGAVVAGVVLVIFEPEHAVTEKAIAAVTRSFAGVFMS
jgi:hypothetical protein